MATPSAGVSAKAAETGLLWGLKIVLLLPYDNREAGTAHNEAAFASQYRKSVLGKLAPLLLAIDGEESAKISPGDTVEIVRAPRPARIAFLPGYSPYRVLSRKLGWTGGAPLRG